MLILFPPMQNMPISLYSVSMDRLHSRYGINCQHHTARVRFSNGRAAATALIHGGYWQKMAKGGGSEGNGMDARYLCGFLKL